MSGIEVASADLWSTGIAADSHPVSFARARLEADGVRTLAALERVRGGERVSVTGVVTHRQRPSTAKGTIFWNLEDETGRANVICPPGVWARYRRVAMSSAALIVHGRLERAEGAYNLVAERLERLDLAVPANRSRDFR
jgi:error-prone DNA polymerase